jgi:lantibiotic biosynthesis protein
MRPTASQPSPDAMSSDAAFLEAGASVGRRIVSDAVWLDGCCSWIGAVEEPVQAQRSELRALGPDLYGGTAGVGLFLAHLAAATGDADARRTAVGALRHAAGRAAPRDGFHSGSLGIAWAAVRAGALLGSEELQAVAGAVVRTARPAAAPTRRSDVGKGAAGTALALLALGLADEAAATGESLLARARITRHGWSWAPGHLCGLSHGAAGIGVTFAELFAATGDERFRAAADGAFAYERSWLDPASGTWPDLRIPGQRRGFPLPAATAGTWCHGEAGIALSRLHAVERLGDDALRYDVDAALGTTRHVLTAALPHEIEDLSLCHGAGGAADVLLSAADADLAAEAGQVAIERHSAEGDWPCGTAAGTTPGLFLGLSGIGWLFLRLHDPEIPSPLVLPISGR